MRCIDMFPSTDSPKNAVDMFPRTDTLKWHSFYPLKPCGDGMSSVTKQVKKYRNRLKIRDSERFAEFGSFPESFFRVLTSVSLPAFWQVETISEPIYTCPKNETGGFADEQSLHERKTERGKQDDEAEGSHGPWGMPPGHRATASQLWPSEKRPERTGCEC